MKRTKRYACSDLSLLTLTCDYVFDIWWSNLTSSRQNIWRRTKTQSILYRAPQDPVFTRALGASSLHRRRGSTSTGGATSDRGRTSPPVAPAPLNHKKQTRGYGLLVCFPRDHSDHVELHANGSAATENGNNERVQASCFLSEVTDLMLRAACSRRSRACRRLSTGWCLSTWRFCRASSGRTGQRMPR